MELACKSRQGRVDGCSEDEWTLWVSEWMLAKCVVGSLGCIDQAYPSHSAIRPTGLPTGSEWRLGSSQV